MSHPQLDNPVRIGRMKADTAAESELQGLVRSGTRRLDDAARESLSLESRFDLAYAEFLRCQLGEDGAFRRHRSVSSARHISPWKVSKRPNASWLPTTTSSRCRCRTLTAPGRRRVSWTRATCATTCTSTGVDPNSWTPDPLGRRYPWSPCLPAWRIVEVGAMGSGGDRRPVRDARGRAGIRGRRGSGLMARSRSPATAVSVHTSSAPSESVVGVQGGRDGRRETTLRIARGPRDGTPIQPGASPRQARSSGERLDIVLLNDAPALLRHRVIRDGILLFARSDAERVRFVLRTIREYQDLEPRLREHTCRRVLRLRERRANGRYGDILEMARRAGWLLGQVPTAAICRQKTVHLGSVG